jgi:ABC-type Fe3+-siderophore transport system permease subunit
MTLQKLHRILIMLAMGLGLLLVVFSTYRYVANGESAYLPTGVIGALAAVGLFFYLRWFKKKNAA